MKRHLTTLQQLREELAELHPHGDHAANSTLKALKIIKKALRSIEKEIHQHGFPSVEDEIFYFKEIKPPICSLQIAYGLILQIEQLRNITTPMKLKKTIKGKSKFLKEHVKTHSEFVAYYNSRWNHLDEKYFLRANKCIVHSNPLLSAQELTTGYDVIAAYVLAYRFFVDHYHSRETMLNASQKTTQLTWSKDKVAFVELISGLHAIQAIQGGGLDLKTLTTEMGALFGIEIKDIYGKRKEIKARKGERFKFLRQMIEQLEEEFDQSWN